MFFTFDSIPPGPYALNVIHDKDKDGKLDFKLFPYVRPKEGVGVSNNSRPRGKPKYENAVFTVPDKKVSLHIELFY